MVIDVVSLRRRMKTNINGVLQVFLLALFCFGFGSEQTVAAPQKSVLIINYDSEERGEIAEGLYREVVSRISNHIRKAGFATRDPLAFQTASRDVIDTKKDSSLLSALRKNNEVAADQKVDFVAVMQILADMVLLEEGTRINVQIKGRLLDVASENVLARFDIALPSDFTASPDCDRKCSLGLLRDNTSAIAEGLGRLLGQRLQELSGKDT
jgi:hypothetical protein